MSKQFISPSRRLFIRTGLSFAGLAALLGHAKAGVAPRALAFENLHTGEKLAATYWADGSYQPEAVQQISWVLRDHRSNLSRAMDPELLELLHALGSRLEVRQPFQVISGYRSPKTNATLVAKSDGVATRSLHMEGKAIDIRIAGTTLRNVRDAARSLRGGGVGYYPDSDFVHIDTGRPRTW